MFITTWVSYNFTLILDDVICIPIRLAFNLIFDTKTIDKMKNLIIILFTIVTIGCDNGQKNSNSTDIETTLIGKGNLHGAGEESIEQQRLIITDQDSWLSLLDQMNSVNNVSDSFAETEIDFSEFTVIAVFNEMKGTGGHRLELNVSSNSESIVVDITEISPEGMATTVVTQPYIIVKIPNSDLPIVFQ